MKKTGQVLSRIFPMLLFMLVGGICGVMIGRYLASFDGGLMGLALLIVLMYAVMLVQIAIHEAGHLIFGLISGYRFSSYRLFSFMWVRQNGKICFKRFSLAGTGGQCLMEPPELVDGRIPVTLYNLGGSLLNLVASALALALCFLVADRPLLSLFLRLSSFLGVAFALLNGIPMRLGAVDNDGYNALALRRDREALRAFWVQMKVNAATMEGLRLKDMPEAWFALPSDGAMANPMMAAVAVLACNRLLDQHRFAEADALMERVAAAKGTVGVYKGLLRCDRMYIALIGEGTLDKNAIAPDREQKKFMKSMKSFPGVIRTEYALALLHEQNQKAAEKVLHRFEKCAESYPSRSDIESERELMKIARMKA